MKLAIIIPAYNEEKVIGHVVQNLPKKLEGISDIQIIVVNDGSQDKTSRVAEEAGALVISHFINLGAGAATQTGFDAAVTLGVDIIATFDGDGQHHSEDIQKLIQPIVEQRVDVVSGSRFLRKQKIPAMRRLFNGVGNLITYLLSGIWMTDSQTGMRAFSREAVEQMEIHVNGYEFCSEIVREISYLNLRYTEIPIRVTYNTYTKKKGQNFATGLQTVTKLAIRSLMR
ncbi:glycosyltransferase family 2 protein [Candidatus Peregrinibacteria bacterium CG_4_10_14_0_2_um_filter_43_11]|nr:MAG: glycosyltransferase family 2 protein [Candidatus Peregrinibacteria bacterium CG_4_10_14_0_2_um_filter_43_11]